ncbi:MAG: hypothetical protein QOI15_450 [Pseudonocardiales bacterium]|jgi:hypothetical protein|nr:hypothetical protein [Pseudonocardiales bacterium]
MTIHRHLIETTLALALAAPAGASPPPRPEPSAPTVQVVRVATPDRFDWGDAGIGAAGGLGLAMLALGGGLVVAGRPGRRRSAVTSMQQRETS